MRIVFKTFILGMGISSVGLQAFSSGPPIMRTGAAVDGGMNCSVCHRTFAPANSDPRGSVVISAATYTPGVKQIIKVTVSHPEAMRWGFELTARPTSDLTTMAGSFTPVANMIRVACAPSGMAPCGGSLEFATHVAASTANGQANGNTFEVEWTPPANEVGEITFFAAGNAANGDGGLTGDRIYTTQLNIQGAGACNNTVKPNLRGFGNAASGIATLSANTYASAFGLSFGVAGRSRLAGSGDLRNGAFPAELACVAVEIGGVRAPITYVQADQINFQVPTISALGPVEARVILNPGRQNELRSDVAMVTMAAYSPAFFVFAPSKSIAATTIDGKLLFNGVAAKPGDLVTLYGTGFGLGSPVYQAGEITPEPVKLRDPVTVTIGGTTLAAVDIQYAGLAPGAITGLMQFNVKVPASAADGDVPVKIAIGGVSTQDGATIPVKK